jgi:hypothetical protein
MTTLLSRAFKQAEVLPESLQDELARELLEDIDGEQKWESALRASSSRVDTMAEMALKEFKKGKTIDVGIDEL